jgi:hypothetical protein
MDNPVFRSSGKQNTGVMKLSIAKEGIMLRGYYSFKHCGIVSRSEIEGVYIIHSNICSITDCGEIIVMESDQQSVLSSHN